MIPGNRTPLLCAHLFMLTSLVNAESVHFRTFSEPIPVGQYLVFTSVDTRSLICIRGEGGSVWVKKGDVPLYAFPWDKSSVLVQRGRDVVVVAVAQGAERLLFQLPSADDRMHSDETGSVLYFGHGKGVTVVGPNGGIGWSNSEALRAVCCTEDAIIWTAGEERDLGDGFHRIREKSVVALDRATGEERWRLPLPVTGIGFTSVIQIPPHLVVQDGDATLLCVAVATGAIERMLEIHAPAAQEPDQMPWRGIVNIGRKDDRIAYLTSQRSRTNIGTAEYTLHFCALPSFREVSNTSLELVEITSFEIAGKLVLTRSLAGCACFNVDSGHKLWSKRQMEASNAIDGEVCFSQQRVEDGTTWFVIGMIEVSSGEERILYREKGGRPPSRPSR